ncbi:FAD-dependent oxidoreductase [Micromonospora sp. M12]
MLLGRQEPGVTTTPKVKAYLRSALDRLGIRVRSGIEVVKVLPDSVELAGGEHVSADVVVWTSGTRVSPLAAAAGLTVDERGRIVTDTVLRSVSHPTCMPWATRPRSGRATASCTAPARVACRPACTRRCRSSAP